MKINIQRSIIYTFFIVCIQVLQRLRQVYAFSQKLRSDINDLIWAYNLYLLAFVQRTLYVLLLLLSGVNLATSSPLQMPSSEINYSGASSNNAFVATEPYVVNIQGTATTISLNGAPRSHDFSGKAPFLNPLTLKNDPFVFQAWSSGLVDWYGSKITNTGVPGRIEKSTFGSDTATMIKYNAGDDIAYEKCRTQLSSFPVPPRTHVRWDLEVAFGKADGVNNWTLTPSAKWVDDGTGKWVIGNGGSPVLFWALTSPSQSNGPLGFDVDTDDQDPTKLMISVSQRVGKATAKTQIVRVHGIPRHTLIPIAIEAFLDERAPADGGKGLLQIWVNNTLVLEKAGPTLALGTKTHTWSIDTYLWNEPYPYQYNRATFWKTAKMRVFPVDTTSPSSDTTPPSAPTSLVATVADSTKVNLSWSGSIDNVGVGDYSIYRNGIEIGTSVTNSFTDATVVGGTTYTYTVKANDDAGNQSASSNTVTVQTPKPVNISSYFVNSITANTATINWTTNMPTTGSVYYGTNSSNLSAFIADSTLSTSHSMLVTGLTKRTTFYYKIVAKDSANATVESPISKFKTTWR